MNRSLAATCTGTRHAQACTVSCAAAQVPWGAANHCYVTFEEFITTPWSPGQLAKGRTADTPPPRCPKYQDSEANYHHKVIGMYGLAPDLRWPANCASDKLGLLTEACCRALPYWRAPPMLAAAALQLAC